MLWLVVLQTASSPLVGLSPRLADSTRNADSASSRASFLWFGRAKSEGIFGARLANASRGMGAPEKRKQSLYFPDEMLREIETEANRQDRSISWIVQRAWKTARDAIMKIPATSFREGDSATGASLPATGKE